MNGVALLMGLLGLSYLGSSLVSRRAANASGLPSGIEYAVLGFVVGPHALGVVAAEDLAIFAPVAQVALGWLAFAAGIDFGFDAHRRVSAPRLILASVSGLVTAAAVGAATWCLLGRLTVPILGTERLLVALAVVVVCSGSAAPAASWVGQSSSEAPRPVAGTLDDVARSEGWIPLVALAVMFALTRSPTVGLGGAPWQWVLGTLGLGAILGAGAALLLRGDMPAEDTWAVLLGVVLLAVGTVARVELSTLAVCFAMGLAVSALSRRSTELRRMVRSTGRPVLLPALVLAGLRLDLHLPAVWPWIALVAIAARSLVRIVLGWTLAAGFRALRTGGPLVGLSLVSSSALSIGIGLSLALRFPGTVGDTALAVAVVCAAFGDLVSPVVLRRALRAAGEIDPPASTDGAAA